jgi:hypothetical protein
MRPLGSPRASKAANMCNLSDTGISIRCYVISEGLVIEELSGTRGIYAEPA